MRGECLVPIALHNLNRWFAAAQSRFGSRIVLVVISGLYSARLRRLHLSRSVNPLHIGSAARIGQRAEGRADDVGQLAPVGCNLQSANCARPSPPQSAPVRHSPPQWVTVANCSEAVVRTSHLETENGSQFATDSTLTKADSSEFIGCDVDRQFLSQLLRLGPVGRFDSPLLAKKRGASSNSSASSRSYHIAS